MVLDEPAEDDFLINQSGITIAVPQNLAKTLPEVFIDFGSAMFGKKFIVYTSKNSACS